MTPTALTTVNAALRFLLELATLVVFGYWGYALGDTRPVKLGLGLGLPLGVAVIWAVFGSPAAPYRLEHPWRLLLEVTILGGATVALSALDEPMVAVGFGILAGVSTTLSYALGQS